MPTTDPANTHAVFKAYDVRGTVPDQVDEALVLTVVVEQLADFLGVPAEDVHPDYEP